MKTLTTCLAILSLVAGCSSTPSAPPKAMEVVEKPQGVQQQKSGVAVESDVIQPVDARWTLVCQRYGGVNHVERAKIAKQQAAQVTAMKGFYVVHEEDMSTLYYGFYRVLSPRELVDPDRPNTAAENAEGNRAQADREKLSKFEVSLGVKLFSTVMFFQLEPVDPPAPAEWDLRNVDRAKSDTDPTKAFWSLEVAVYKDDAGRKQAAVEAVKVLREQGVRDVYFYHGKVSSSVCIGAWPRDAVREQEMGGKGFVETEDASQEIMVFGQRFAPGVSERIHNAQGRRVKAYAPRLDVADPTMLDTMRRYPLRAVNGYEIEREEKLRSGGTRKVKEPSLVIIIPRDESILNAPTRETQVDPLISLPTLGPGGSGQGGNRLRSLGQQ